MTSTDLDDRIDALELTQQQHELFWAFRALGYRFIRGSVREKSTGHQIAAVLVVNEEQLLRW